LPQWYLQRREEERFELEADSLQITTARMQGNLLILEATANSAPTGRLSFSVEGFTFESPMS
jgi:hypothetical protein